MSYSNNKCVIIEKIAIKGYAHFTNKDSLAKIGSLTICLMPTA